MLGEEIAANATNWPELEVVGSEGLIQFWRHSTGFTGFGQKKPRKFERGNVHF
jgi:hypothetical protein